MKNEKNPYLAANIIVALLILAVLFAGAYMLYSSKNTVAPISTKNKIEQTEEAEQSGETDTIAEDVELSRDETGAVIEKETPIAAADEAEDEEVYEPWDINVPGEVNYIKVWCADTNACLDNYDYYDFGEFSCYAQNGTPVKIMVKSGYNGWDYNREYYGTGIFYIHVYNFSEDYEFYFSDSKLIRYSDENEAIHDYGEENWGECVELSQKAVDEQADLFNYIVKQIN